MNEKKTAFTRTTEGSPEIAIEKAHLHLKET